MIERLSLRNIYSAATAFVIDVGKPEDVIVLAGMGRSGTTWAGNIINYADRHRILFEPFLPAQVPAAAEFEYHQYLSPQAKAEKLAHQARLILAGKVHNPWIDRDNTRRVYRRRIVKDIRCNLMLGWLSNIADRPPIVLMVRHPLQVAASWAKLGWGRETLGSRSNFDIVTSQQPLLDDFPIIQEVMRWLDPKDFVEMVVFLWCIYYLVPKTQLRDGAAHAVFYENLLLDPELEVSALFAYLRQPFEPHKLQSVLNKSSSTNFLGRNFQQDKTTLVNSWQSEFSAKQIDRATQILQAFGLNHLYDQNGYPAEKLQFQA